MRKEPVPSRSENLPACRENAAARFERLPLFHRQAYVCSAVRAVLHIRGYHIREMTGVDYEIPESRRLQASEDVLQQGPPSHADESLGHRIGERFETGSESRRENYSLHNLAPGLPKTASLYPARGASA